jgi:hypothetical protein
MSSDICRTVRESFFPREQDRWTRLRQSGPQPGPPAPPPLPPSPYSPLAPHTPAATGDPMLLQQLNAFLFILNFGPIFLILLSCAATGWSLVGLICWPVSWFMERIKWVTRRKWWYDADALSRDPARSPAMLCGERGRKGEPRAETSIVV